MFSNQEVCKYPGGACDKVGLQLVRVVQLQVLLISVHRDLGWGCRIIQDTFTCSVLDTADEVISDIHAPVTYIVSVYNYKFLHLLLVQFLTYNVHMIN